MKVGNCWAAMKLKMGADLLLVEDVEFEDGSRRVLLVASVDVRRKRKYMFCVDSYRLKVLLGDLFEGLRQCHHCHLRANMNLDVVFQIRNAFYRIEFVLNAWV